MNNGGRTKDPIYPTRFAQFETYGKVDAVCKTWA